MQNNRHYAFQLDEEITTLDASEGVVWRNLRKNMSPTFTSGKLKGMMEPMTEVIDRFVGHLEKMAEEGKEVEIKPILQGEDWEPVALFKLVETQNNINRFGAGRDKQVRLQHGHRRHEQPRRRPPQERQESLCRLHTHGMDSLSSLSNNY